MPYFLKQDDTYFLDNGGNKIEYNVSYIDTYEWYKHKEMLHINDDGHIDSEDRHLIIIEGIQDNHAICKKQSDQLETNVKKYTDNKISALQNLINNSIKNLIKAHEDKILTQMLNFRNDQIINRIERKYIRIPKKAHTVIKLFDNRDIGNDAKDLKQVIILNVWIMRFDRFHHAKSALVEKAFGNIEFFYSADMLEYSTYFTNFDETWNMSAIIEWLRIPQPISIDNESIPIESENNR